MRKILFIALIALSLTFNLRFLQEGSTSNSEAKQKVSFFDKVDNICNAANKVGETWGNLVNAFKTTSSKTIKEFTNGKGFDYFHGSSQVFVIAGLKGAYFDKFWTRKAGHLKLSRDAKKIFVEIGQDSEFMDKQAWNKLDLAFNPEENKKDSVKGVSLLVNQPVDGKFDILITDIRATFKLAPDLLIERNEKSVLGGIFSKTKEKIIKKPKTLGQEELTAILDMYKMVSFKVLCDIFGIQVTLPKF